MRRLLAVLLLLTSAADIASAAVLEFQRGGKLEKKLEIDAIQASCKPRTVSIDDPYYGRKKAFVACPLSDVLRIGFGDRIGALHGETVFFRALDGYAKPVSGALLGEPGAYLAFADADRARDGQSGWEPIEYKQTDPGPLYLVWTEAHQRDTHRYPWPYQLAAIDIASIEQLYPHVAPSSAAQDSPAWVGYAVFTGECIACHAMNGEGGHIGPELNVPQSIVEYRPAEQIKAYVRDPSVFRYTSMPAHPHLSEPQLDGLIAYFSTMRTLKHDPRRAP